MTPPQKAPAAGFWRFKEFFTTTHPWLHSVEKRCTACKTCCEKVIEKVDDLDTRVIAMEERLERQEMILADHLIQQEMMRCKLEELELAIGASLEGS